MANRLVQRVTKKSFNVYERFGTEDYYVCYLSQHPYQGRVQEFLGPFSTTEGADKSIPSFVKRVNLYLKSMHPVGEWIEATPNNMPTMQNVRRWEKKNVTTQS